VSLEAAVPQAVHLRFVTYSGYLGVDLFFALSGFILCHRYLEEMGPELSRTKTLDFLALRFARIYPVHIFMIGVFAAYALVLSRVSGEAIDRGRFGWSALAQNLLMVHAWVNQPISTWNAPSWSISLEWLAYLSFPLIAWCVWRIGLRRRPLRPALVLFVLAYLPMALYATGALTLAQPGAGHVAGLFLARILGGFVGGCAMFVCVRALVARTPQPNVRILLRLRRLCWIALGLSVFLLTRGALDVDHYERQLWIVTPLLALLVAVTSIPGPRSHLLASRFMVGAGLASYSLYMTHAFVMEFFGVWWGSGGFVASHLGLASRPNALGLTYLLAVLSLCGLVAYWVWRLVEEPSRRHLRRLLVPRINEVPIEERGR